MRGHEQSDTGDVEAGGNGGELVAWQSLRAKHMKTQKDSSRGGGEGQHTETQVLGSGLPTGKPQVELYDLMSWEGEHDDGVRLISSYLL